MTGEIKSWEIQPVPYTRVMNRGKVSAQARRYQAFRQECSWRKVWRPTPGDTCIFTFPMPKSWSQKQRDETWGQPHEQVPDTDNLVKGLIDAVYDEDKQIWGIEGYKFWARRGRVIIERGEPKYRHFGEVLLSGY